MNATDFAVICENNRAMLARLVNDYCRDTDADAVWCVREGMREFRAVWVHTGDVQLASVESQEATYRASQGLGF